MPVEACIYLGPPSADGVYDSGDIICVKPVGSPWGTEEEQNLFVVVTIPDLAISGVAVLAAEFAARVNGGEQNPVHAHPFAAFDATTGAMSKASSFFLDKTKLTAAQRLVLAAITNSAKHPRLAAAAVLNAFSTRA